MLRALRPAPRATQPTLCARLIQTAVTPRATPGPIAGGAFFATGRLRAAAVVFFAGRAAGCRARVLAAPRAVDDAARPRLAGGVRPAMGATVAAPAQPIETAHRDHFSLFGD
ncbi:hypothetical protein L3i22_095120 [Actinoplanes sp. L3-i22]|nr:hypothetical protein L3i22_095120 [Actinoplanes sp. L3-i22]